MLGIFDSGSGGLTVLRDLIEKKVGGSIVYFGDLAHAPYGNKSADELHRLTKQGIERLTQEGATHIVSACNSASASFLEGVAGERHVFEMTRPTARMMRAYAGKSVLLVATTATVESRIYEDVLAPIVHLTSCAIPELAGAIERGESDNEIESLIVERLPKNLDEVDAVLLGCTHYPFVLDIFKKVCATQYGPQCVVLDPASAVAVEVARTLHDSGDVSVRLLISKESSVFRVLASRVLGALPYSIEVV